MQTYKMKGEWPFILYAEHIFQLFTFNFIWPLLKAPLHGEPAFIKHENWPYKSQKRDSSFILYGHSPSHYWECTRKGICFYFRSWSHLRNMPHDQIKNLFPLSLFMSDIRKLVPTKVISKSLDLILNKYPPLIVSQDGKLPATSLKWDLHPQWEYQFWECMTKRHP